MKAWSALLTKFVLTLFFAVISFAWVAGGNPWSWIAGLAVAVTFLNYLVGDLAILPAAGNVVASIADGGLGALAAYVLALITPAFQVNLTSLAVFAVLLLAGELFFHRYLLRSGEVEP